MKSLIALILTMGILAANCTAQDRIFNYTYQSNVLGPGQREIEPWATFKWGKSNYRAFEQRLEFEVGLANRLQTSFYFNGSQQTTGDSLATDHDFSFSNEWKYKLMDPVADPIGLALYQEFTFGTKELEWENKLIIDKRFGNHTLACNFVGELEWEKETEGSEVETEKEIILENDLGWSYNVAKGWYLGLESRVSGVYEGGALEHKAVFAGPTMSYLRDQFWVNVTLFPKIAGKPANGQTMEARVILSYAF